MQQSSSENLTAEVSDPRAMSPDLRGAWQRMLLSQDVPTAFLGPTFASVVAETRGDARVCVLRRGGRPVAFFPFQFRSDWKRLLAVGERLGGHLSDFTGVVAEPGFEIDPVKLLRLAGLSSFHVSHLCQSQSRFGLTGEEPRVGLRVEFPEGVNAYWQRRTETDLAKVRQTERRRRKIEREVGPLRFELQRPDSAELLDHLISLKRAQYVRTGSADALGDRGSRALLHGLLRTKADDCEGFMSTLYAGSEWAASHFGVRCGRVLHYWFPVYNEKLSGYSPGRLMVLEMIKSAAQRGVTSLDLGEGDSPSKRQFATSEYHTLRGTWRRGGIGSHIDRVEESLRWRLASKAKVPVIEQVSTPSPSLGGA